MRKEIPKSSSTEFRRLSLTPRRATRSASTGARGFRHGHNVTVRGTAGLFVFSNRQIWQPCDVSNLAKTRVFPRVVTL
jgi:hypothetical protein